MPTIVLVRHGVTPATGKRLGGWTPASLSDEGRAQAEAAAQRLAHLDVAAVYTSPIVRTQETAAIVAAPHGLTPVEHRGLAEVDYGEWTDRPLAELRKEPLWRTIQSAPSRVTFPGGGTIRGVSGAVTDALEEIAGSHGDHDVVLAVSHADVIKAALAQFLGLGLDGFQRIVVSPASCSVVHLAAGHPPMVLRTNDHGPVEVPSPPKDEDAAADGADAGAGDGAGGADGGDAT
jgi:probable phosphoglycerate mutase